MFILDTRFKYRDDNLSTFVISGFYQNSETLLLQLHFFKLNSYMYSEIEER